MSLDLNKFVNIAFEIFVSVCMFIYAFKTPFVIAMVIFDIAMAVSIFNQIQIKIKTKFNLISLGLSIALTIISYFMTSAIAFVLTNTVIILFWRIYYAYNRKQGSYAVKNIIRTQSVIYTGSKESNLQALMMVRFVLDFLLRKCNLNLEYRFSRISINGK